MIAPLRNARIVGGLYALIIALGLTSEVGVRSALIVQGDAAATAANILASQGLFRFAFFADSIVFLSDAAVAVLLYLLLRPVNSTVALAAAAFRLTQTAVLALNLLNQHAALLVLTGTGYAVLDPAQRDTLAYLMLDRHSHGYDLGLLFFGVHCLLLGYLVATSTFLPKLLGILLMGASVAYLVGSYARFLAPALVPTVAPIYIVAIAAEIGLCGWLLVKGVDVQRWKAVAASARLA
jgi:hypothetical protein